jgi:hypothetical protein
MTEKDQTQIVGALKTALISPNEPDRAGEPSNIVDGLFAHAPYFVAVVVRLVSHSSQSGISKARAPARSLSS